MSKPNLVFCGPVTTRSGYGEHARDLLQSLMETDKYNIRVIPINWGDTPMNALDMTNELHQKISSMLITSQLTEQPDIWVQVTVPNEFNPIGKYNIGITAGIETNICSPEWIDGCNRMNLIIVPSKHAKDVFQRTEYDRIDKNTGQSAGKLQINVPIEVLHEGVRMDSFGKDLPMDTAFSDKITNLVKEDFALLFVGHWLRGDVGQDRKDVSGMLITFIKTFANQKDAPALILKCSSGTFSISDKSHTLNKIKMIREIAAIPLEQQPKIYLIHGELSESELNTLYNHPKVKGMVSFTKGEGYGRPIAEFITSGKPVIVSGWSGHVDFTNPAFQTYLDGELTQVHPSSVWDGVINKDAAWFTVNYQKAAEKLRDFKKNYSKYLSNSKQGLPQFKKKWSYEAMHERFESLMDANIPKFAQRLTMNLPKLVKKEPVVPEIKAE